MILKLPLVEAILVHLLIHKTLTVVKKKKKEPVKVSLDIERRHLF